MEEGGRGLRGLGSKSNVREEKSVGSKTSGV